MKTLPQRVPAATRCHWGSTQQNRAAASGELGVCVCSELPRAALPPLLCCVCHVLPGTRGTHLSSQVGTVSFLPPGHKSGLLRRCSLRIML